VPVELDPQNAVMIVDKQIAGRSVSRIPASLRGCRNYRLVDLISVLFSICAREKTCRLKPVLLV